VKKMYDCYGKLKHAGEVLTPLDSLRVQLKDRTGQDKTVDRTGQDIT
jgi:hypothetical protein